MLLVGVELALELELLVSLFGAVNNLLHGTRKFGSGLSSWESLLQCRLTWRLLAKR
jgi:hypothetical protein